MRKRREESSRDRRIAQTRTTGARSRGSLPAGTRVADRPTPMDCDKRKMKMKEERSLSMGTARMLKDNGKKTLRTIQRQVESARRRKD